MDWGRRHKGHARCICSDVPSRAGWHTDPIAAEQLPTSHYLVAVRIYSTVNDHTDPLFTDGGCHFICIACSEPHPSGLRRFKTVHLCSPTAGQVSFRLKTPKNTYAHVSVIWPFKPLLLLKTIIFKSLWLVLGFVQLFCTCIFWLSKK